jgi:hypothetical protein
VEARREEAFGKEPRGWFFRENELGVRVQAERAVDVFGGEGLCGEKRRDVVAEILHRAFEEEAAAFVFHE